MFGHTTRVKRDILRWREGGLIDAATAKTLSSEIDRHGESGISFGAVLSMMAAALFAAAILVFIAANWEEIPRLARVAMLFAAIAAGYVGGAYAKLRGFEPVGEGAWVVAATAFGASIALIGQMYHMSGDEKQAILVWCAGTALAAAALRSPALTIGASILAGVWMLMHAFEHWTMRELPLAYPLLALVLYALTFWTRSAASRHLLVLSLILYAFLLYWRDETFDVPLVLIAASILLLAVGYLRPVEAERFLGLGSGLHVHALIGFMTGISTIQITLVDDPEFLFASIAAFVGVIAALLLVGRSNAPLRWLAYASFVFQLCFVYVVMLGSMLGTAGFFLLGGLALSVLAFVISRLEKRFAESEPTEATP